MIAPLELSIVMGHLSSFSMVSQDYQGCHYIRNEPVWQWKKGKIRPAQVGNFSCLGGRDI
jgi:hypothetical protein